MKLFFSCITSCLLLLSCSSDDSDSNDDNKLINDIRDLVTNEQPVCPETEHTDSIVEIVYGEPSEELFREADSGLVALGGCEIMDETHWCQRHKISFEFP